MLCVYAFYASMHLMHPCILCVFFAVTCHKQLHTDSTFMAYACNVRSHETNGMDFRLKFTVMSERWLKEQQNAWFLKDRPSERDEIAIKKINNRLKDQQKLNCWMVFVVDAVFYRVLVAKNKREPVIFFCFFFWQTRRVCVFKLKFSHKNCFFCFFNYEIWFYCHSVLLMI